MIEIIVNGQLVAICLPELVNLIVQALVPNLAPGYKIETKIQQKKEAK